MTANEPPPNNLASAAPAPATTEPPQLQHAPQRVVSLVPSLTESLFDLDLGASVVGITDYCIHPSSSLQGLPRLGGTKNPRLADILALQPDLVLANWEENTASTIKGLQKAGVPVWVTFTQTVRHAIDVLWTLAGLYGSRTAIQRLEALEHSLDWARSAAASQPEVPFFCPIWYDHTAAGDDWWMTFNRQTYPSDLLSLFGGSNLFADRQRRFPLAADLGQADEQAPGERDTRYPRLSLQEIREANPKLILLPDEPFKFTEAHRQELFSLLSDTHAARNGQIMLVDGSLITWHGTRLALALRELPALFASAGSGESLPL